MITETFDDPLGRFVGYETEDLDVNTDLQVRSHIDIRAFTSSIDIRPQTIYDISELMSDLDPLTLTNLEEPAAIPLEIWTLGSFGPDPALGNRNSLRLNLPDTNPVTTTSSEDYALDFSEMDPNSTISMSLPSFPASSLDLANCQLSLSVLGGTEVVLSFDETLQPLTNGDIEAAWPLSLVGDLKPTIVSIKLTATVATSVTIAALRVLPPNWTPTTLDINTVTHRLKPVVTPTGEIPTTPFPQMWREDQPIDTKLGINFYTGSSTGANSITLFFRERREDFLTQLDIDTITTQADLDAYGVQPDYGRAVYNPHPQTDYDAMQQSSLDSLSQFEMERQPDLVSEAWLQIKLEWGVTNQITFSTTETTSSTESVLPISLSASTRYLAIFEVVENSMRAKIMALDPFGKVNPVPVFDSQEISDSFLVHRRKGRVGWKIDLQDGDTYVDSIRSRGEVYNEVVTQNFESLTPIIGARLSVGSTPDTITPLGVIPFNDGELSVDTQISQSGDGSVKVVSPTELSGFQSDFYTFENFDNTEISFDLYYTDDQPLPQIYLYSKQALFVTIGMPGLIANRWNHVSIPLFRAAVEQTGDYRVIVAPSSAASIFWVDNLQIVERSTRWSGRSIRQNPWGQQKNIWTDFRGLVNSNIDGVMFDKRDRFLQIKGQSLSPTATVDKAYIRPQYAQLGRLASTGQAITDPLPIILASHYVRFDVTPHGATVSSGTTTWSDAYYHSIGTELTFTATVYPGSVPLDIIEYYWDFGDGTEAYTTVPTVTHIYQVANMGLNAHVRALNADGREAWASKNLMLQ